MAVLETICQDLCYSLRVLRKSPTFTITAVLTLALGIGGNTAMFTIIRAVLLKPLEYRDPQSLVRISVENPHGRERDGSFTALLFEQMTRSAKSFSGIGAYLKFKEDMSLSVGCAPEALKGARVSANFLNVLGVRPVAGRGFLPQEDAPGGPAVTMISSDLWKRRFKKDPRISGVSVTLNSTRYTIVGVLPEGFTFPFVGADVWVTRPREWSVLLPRFWPFVTLLDGFARLNPQVSLPQAQAEMDVLNQQYIRAHPRRLDAGTGFVLQLSPLRDHLVSKVRPTLWMLSGAVAFVLLIACANVASLLLIRASARSREFAVRAAIGAIRMRLVAQLLVESLALSVAGGIAGALLARWAVSAVNQISALNLPGVGEIRLDGSVLAFTLAISIVAGVLFGLFPSLQVSRPDLAGELRESGASAGHAGARHIILGLSARNLLVVGQISLSIVLLIGATLLIKSFARLRGVNPGFQPANVLSMKIALPPIRYDQASKKIAFFSELVQRVESVAGVRSAAVVMSLPTASDWLGTNVFAGGQPTLGPEKQASARVQSITPGYFRTMQIPLRGGREFVAPDNNPGAPPVAIINESFARQFWPAYPHGQNPVGQHLKEGLDKTGWIEIVGIVADVHESGLAVNPVSEFYVPLVIHAPQSASLVARTRVNPSALVRSIRNQVLAIDKDQPVSDVATIENVLEATLGQRRLTMLLLGSFAAMALLLAVIGIYGAIAHSVAQRTQELGIRRALGAQRGDILQLVLSQGLALALAGVMIGVLGALALTRLMKDMLFEVSATDPRTFVFIALLFVLIALIASLIPAHRAAQVDPMTALRVG
jgi:predicted permease